jgi:hypothetical protein
MGKSKKDPTSQSEHEGLIVDSGPYRFRILNGRRVWLSPVPPDVLPTLLR